MKELKNYLNALQIFQKLLEASNSVFSSNLWDKAATLSTNGGEGPDQQLQFSYLLSACKLTPSMSAFRRWMIYNRHIHSCQLSRKISEYNTFLPQKSMEQVKYKQTAHAVY